jgi:hypothetical protein
MFGSARLIAFGLFFAERQAAHGAASGSVGYRCVADLLGFGSRSAALERLLLERLPKSLLRRLDAFRVHGGFR